MTKRYYATPLGQFGVLIDTRSDVVVDSGYFHHIESKAESLNRQTKTNRYKAELFISNKIH